MVPRVVATIDLNALRSNLRRVRELAPGTKVMAAIKADGYGHGAVPVARALSGCDAFAVACMEEAILLRNAGIGEPIALLEGILSADEAESSLRHDLQMVIHSDWQLDLLDSLSDSARPQLWIKLDTGMNRLGFPPERAADLHRRLASRSQWQFCGWMTHLACADNPDHPMTRDQLRRFSSALCGIPGPRSIANSAGIINFPDSHADWVRPGLMLYGASPIRGVLGGELGLQPAMRLESRIIAIHDLAPGQTIGYGASWRCVEQTRVAVVAVGYGDGWHRSLPSGTPVVIAGQRRPMVGRVSMDMITVDLGRLQAQVGDPVLLWGGPDLCVEEIAERAGTLAYEPMCGLTQRVRFRQHGG